MMQTTWYRYCVFLALALAWCVVMLGAYTRLTHAGLGCPDWPGCYGHMVLPKDQGALVAAQQSFPETPIESTKAWTEMVHRYAAGTLGLLIVLLGWMTVSQKKAPISAKLAAFALIALLVGQALLGMWTVTLKLLPVVVMSHLLGGILIFSCLGLLAMQALVKTHPQPSHWQLAALLGVLLVFMQIALGGWVSSNYAGIACIGFPQCNGQWWPALHLAKGFNLLSPVGLNYQGGLLDHQSRMTIQFIHRLGAVLTASYVLGFALFSLVTIREKLIRALARIVLVIVMVQFSLGVINVLYILPLWAAVAHNGVAALLLAVMLMLFYQMTGKRHDI